MVSSSLPGLSSKLTLVGQCSSWCQPRLSPMMLAYNLPHAAALLGPDSSLSLPRACRPWQTRQLVGRLARAGLGGGRSGSAGFGCNLAGLHDSWWGHMLCHYAAVLLSSPLHAEAEPAAPQLHTALMQR